MKASAALVAVILLALLSSSRASAGPEVTNGGDAVVCRDKHGAIKSASLLDFYEAPLTHGFKPDFGNDKNTRAEDFAILIERIRSISPQRALDYQLQGIQFTEDTRFVSDGSLIPIDDAAAVFIPKGCAIEQVAIHRELDELRGDPHYFIAKEIWDHLSARDQAGLLLHEFSYRELRNYGHTTSFFARTFTAYIAANQQVKLKTQLDIYDFFRDLNFARTDINGVNITVSTCPGSLKPQAFCDSGATGEQTLPNFKIDGQMTSAKMDTSHLTLFKLQKSQGDVFSPWASKLTLPTIEFFPSGSVKRIDGNVQLQVPIANQRIITATGLSFFDSFAQHVHCAVLTENAEVFYLNGQRLVLDDVGIELNENGDLVRYWGFSDPTPESCPDLYNLD